MALQVKGAAILRETNTDREITIQPEELEWDTEGEERNMGPELHHRGEVSHPELGDLVWEIWEYPVGVFNHEDHDLNGHTLVQNFDFDVTLDEETGDE